MFAILLAVLLPTGRVYATDYEEEAQLRKELPIQSNDIAGWPHGPEITAQAAIVMEANTGTILYAKNIHEELYPASTTKIMTCLLAVENASLSDMRIEFLTSQIVVKDRRIDQLMEENRENFKQLKELIDKFMTCPYRKD